MTDRRVSLDRGRIAELLTMLDNGLRDVGVSSSLYVVGGAAIAMTITDRRVTVDIDVARLDDAVARQAKIIASDQHLPDAWLNAAAAPWVPTVSPTDQTTSAGPGLHVRYAPPHHLLAMKMVALRQQDAPDIAALARHLGVSSETQLVAVLVSAYPGEGELSQILGVPDDRVDAETTAVAQRVAGFLISGS